MALFDNNKQEKNEPRRIVGGFLGHPRDNSNAGPVLSDVVSKKGNVIRLGDSIKKNAEVSKRPSFLPAAKPILEINPHTLLRSDETREKDSHSLMSMMGLRGVREGVGIKKEIPYKKLELTKKNVLIPNLARRADSAKKTRFISIIGSVLLFVFFVVFFSFAFSRSIITLRVKITTVPLAETAITVDPKATAVNINTKRLPGLYIEATKSAIKNFEAKTVGYTESKARGSITIFNNFGTSPQVLIKTTRFESKLTGLVYRLQETITVPGALKQGDKLIPGSIKAEVMADEIGEKYNIAPDDFVIPAFKGSPRYQGFYAKSLEAFHGGLRGAGALVTAEELQGAEEEVTAKVFEDAKKELESKVPPGFKLLPGAKAIKITKVSKPHVGEAVRTFTVAADAVASATLFKEDDLFLLLSKLVVKEGSKEVILKQKSDVFKDINKTNFDFDSRLLTFNLVSNLVLSFDINQDELKKEIGGKSKSEAEAILRSRPEFTGFVVEISPFWIKKVPSNPKKIEVKIEL